MYFVQEKRSEKERVTQRETRYSEAKMRKRESEWVDGRSLVDILREKKEIGSTLPSVAGGNKWTSTKMAGEEKKIRRWRWREKENKRRRRKRKTRIRLKYMEKKKMMIRMMKGKWFSFFFLLLLLFLFFFLKRKCSLKIC